MAHNWIHIFCVQQKEEQNKINKNDLNWNQISDVMYVLYKAGTHLLNKQKNFIDTQDSVWVDCCLKIECTI